MNEPTIVMGAQNPVRRYLFDPVGVTHELQQLITDLMHQIVMQDGQYTLAEMGYLHMSSIGFVNDHVEVKVYFAPELATRSSRALNGIGSIEPNPNLNIFKNYLFVGDAKDNSAFVNMNAPKYTIDRDARDQLAVTVKSGKKNREEMELLVLYCNLDLIIGAYYDTNILDPEFSVTYETIGNSSKNTEDNPGIMISMGANQEFPVRVRATVPMEGEYHPEDAIPYLLSKMQARKETKKAKKELARKVSDSAEEMVKKNNKKLDLWKKFR